MKLYLAGEHSVKNGALALTFDGLVSRRHTDSQGRESDSVRRERESMNLYLAQISTHEGVWRSTHTHTHTQDMHLYIAGNHPLNHGKQAINLGWWKDSHVLESFYYVQRNKYFPLLYAQGADLMLDSGAFSVLDNGMRVESWDAYIEEYAAFIKRYDISKFIELDIESVVGMKEMERLRNKLEKLTGKQCMPVWHKWRGLDYFKRMCDEYPYVCFGGLMSDGVSLQKLEQVFPWFISEAHKRGAKIHCLGYSPTDLSKKPFRFDSVDSSSWVSGNRFGHIYLFNESKGIMEKFDKKAGQRVKHREAAEHNLREWLKYQKYLLTI